MPNRLIELFKPDYWLSFFSENLSTWDIIVNLLDIFVVWFLIYRLFELVRGTKAVQLLKGVAIFIGIRIVAELIGLHTLSWLMNQVITYGVIAAIIIFQPEVRRGLEHLGRSAFFKTSKKEELDDERMILAFDKAIQYMSKRKIGARVTIQRSTGLDEYIETGIDLHDGAVIVKDGKIAVASAYLPLSDSMLIPKEFGTRHRAAVGISEVSDALTFIVSEETGGVSITLSNDFLHDLTQEEYLAVMRRELLPDEKIVGRKSLLQTFLEGLTKGGKK